MKSNQMGCPANRPQRRQPEPMSCNTGNPFVPMGDPDRRTCKKSVANVFRALIQAVSTCGLPGASVNVVVVLTDGYEYDITIGAGIQTQLIICEDTITYGNYKIVIEDIAKIEVLTSQLTNTSLVSMIKDELYLLTLCGGPNFPVPLAMTLDEDDEEHMSPLSRGGCYKKRRQPNQQMNYIPGQGPGPVQIPGQNQQWPPQGQQPAQPCPPPKPVPPCPPPRPVPQIGRAHV